MVIATVIITLTLALTQTGPAQASSVTTTAPARLTPALGQANPQSLLKSIPIPAVASAVTATKLNAPIPTILFPSLNQLAVENTHANYDTPAGCTPAFGLGISSQLCRLGDPTARPVVVVIGDSHAGMWMPALIADARVQGFTVVPLDKPGCLLFDLHHNTASWPCASWYQWALQEDHLLHPVATLVSFWLNIPAQTVPEATTRALHAVLKQVTHGVLIADPPNQTQMPATCLAAVGATLGQCSTPVPQTYPPLLRKIAAMTTRYQLLVIPTLQWFCASGICPMVINNTLTDRDDSHLSEEYSAALAPLMGPELRPILKTFEQT